MSASASFLTGKNRRRAFQALIAGSFLVLGVAAGPGTAHAAPLTFTPAEVHLADGHCSVSGWPHGEIFCGTSAGANFPNGTQEIFGIGLDDGVWTDWGTEARPSGWVKLGVQTFTCDTDQRLQILNLGNYQITITCSNSEDAVIWANARSAGVNGTWAGWVALL
jgi:hypothetical protein